MADWVIRAIPKVSAILIKSTTFDGFFHVLMGQNEYKIRVLTLYIVESAKKLINIQVEKLPILLSKHTF